MGWRPESNLSPSNGLKVDERKKRDIAVLCSFLTILTNFYTIYLVPGFQLQSENPCTISLLPQHESTFGQSEACCFRLTSRISTNQSSPTSIIDIASFSTLSIHLQIQWKNSTDHSSGGFHWISVEFSATWQLHFHWNPLEHAVFSLAKNVFG